NVTPNWSANGYRLPTEAEWEYAARSRGKKEKWAGTSNEASLKEYANYGGSGTKPVKNYKPNNLGLYDMSGNVWEWCWDWHDSDYYANSKNASNPKGPSTGSYRVFRGGSWGSAPWGCRAANRLFNGPTLRGNRLGFRVALSSR
ncbi:MAG: SUMF1/EgtB/PvdO family nonheme iron enzyme, partial [Bacteroidota bacterium]